MRILVAIDGSVCSDAAVAEVGRRPWPPESQVRLITVVPPIDPNLLRGTSPTVFDEVVKQQLAQATEHLNAAAALLRQQSPALAVHSTLLEGRPKETIVEEAAGWGADLG